MRIFFVTVFFISFFGAAFSQNQDSTVSNSVKVSGFIKGEKNMPVEGANLVIEGTIDGTTTDNVGYFEFETEKTGSRILIITAIDYSEKKLPVEITSGKDLQLNITLSKSSYTTDEITVTASSFTSGENSKVTLTPIEIVRIPGADADLYRAITTFPGSNQVDEGSRIAVRGGEPNEVLTILDQASLYNPFIFDNDNNVSSFSTVNPWGLKGINFSSGGFSSKFGNVLSAVLDLQTYDIPKSNSLFAIIGLANAGLSGVFANKEGTFGGTFTAGQFFLKPFLLINHTDADYSPMPTASSLGGTLSYKVSKTGYLKLYADYNSDNLGIKSQSPTYEGYYAGKSKNFFTNLALSVTPTSVSLLNVSISSSVYNRKFNFGIIDNTSNDIYAKLRSDFSMPVTNKIDFGTGAEYEYSGYNSEGVYPLYFYNIGLNAPKLSYSSKNKTGRFGAYAETKIKPHDNFYIVGGIRGDYHTLSQNFNFDPRLSVVYRLSKHSFLKGATGIYHQYAALSDYTLSFNNNLKPQQAIHYILGYEYNRDNDFILRIESYYKKYSKLVSNSTYGFLYGSDGEGFAKGADVFLKVRLKPKFNGWISYSYTDSKRKQYSTGPLESSTYDITHNVSVVATYNITDFIYVGATYHISTGKPYTPVYGSVFDSTQSAYVPSYASFNSDRFPTYKRIDINAQYVFSFFGKFAIAFLALNNILDEKNLYGYTYNFDYSQRIALRSNNNRVIYFGMGFQL
jgi:vitamin B12 transporter